MVDIAADCTMSHANLYRFFGSKTALVEIIDDGNARGEFRVGDPHRLARIIQHATVRFCDPRQVAQYADETLEAQARDVMILLVAGISHPGEPGVAEVTTGR